jgi:CRP-like cAMP-binding protein
LKSGDYFGEIALATNLKRTSTVFAVSNVICGRINRQDFKELMQSNGVFKNRIMKKMKSYSDNFFKLIVTMLRNISFFR